MKKVKTSQLLMKQAPCIPVNSRFPIEEYYDRAERLMRQAMIYRASMDHFNLFVIQARFSSLLLDTIPKHQEFKHKPANRERYKKLNEPLYRAISELESLTKTLDQSDDQGEKEKVGRGAMRTGEPAAKREDTGGAAGASGADNVLPLDDLCIRAPGEGSAPGEGGEQKLGGVGPGAGEPVDLLSGTSADLLAAARGTQRKPLRPEGSTAASAPASGSVVSYPSMDSARILSAAAPVVPEVAMPVTIPPPGTLSAPQMAGAVPPPPPPPPSNGAMQMPPPPPPTSNGAMVQDLPPPPPPPADYLEEPRMTAHLPKVVENVPTKEVADMDYMNLADRLKHYGLKEKKVKGDGNCQFRSLADQLFGTMDRHEEVRKMAIGQLRNHSDLYKPYVPEEYDQYVNTMAKDGEWGDHVTLQAAADVYGRRICVLSSYKTSFIIDIKPQETLHPRVLWLSFWAEVHYNSLYPSGS